METEPQLVRLGDKLQPNVSTRYFYLFILSLRRSSVGPKPPRGPHRFWACFGSQTCRSSRSQSPSKVDVLLSSWVLGAELTCRTGTFRSVWLLGSVTNTKSHKQTAMMWTNRKHCKQKLLLWKTWQDVNRQHCYSSRALLISFIIHQYLPHKGSWDV